MSENSAAQSPPPPPPAINAASTKKTWIAHDPETMKKIGTYTGKTARTAALKAASRFANVDETIPIVLRETNTKILRHFDGTKVSLNPPKIVPVGDRKIVYKTKAAVKEVKGRQALLQ